MMYIWFILLLVTSPLENFQRIAHRNQYTQQAEAAYSQKEFLKASALYEKVRQFEGGKPHHSVVLNLAHSYFHLHEYTQASPLYRSLLKTTDTELLSTVATQLAVIEAEEGNCTKALGFCKQALKADESNQAARYNFELLQKYLLLHPEKRENQRMPPKNTSQNGSGSSRQPNSAGSSALNSATGSTNLGAGNASGGVGENITPEGQSNVDQMQNSGEEAGLTKGVSSQGSGNGTSGGANKGSNQAGQEEDALLQTRYERLKKLQLSPVKARQLLDAMRQEEAQYLQQVPRTNTKNKNKNTPDW